MKNKVLIKLIVPEIDNTFDVFVPVNELVWKVKKLLVKSVSDLSNGALELKKEYILINKITGECYSNNITIFNTDIRNATELVLLSIKEATANSLINTKMVIQ